MTDDLRERVTEVLHEADAATGSIVSGAEPDDEDLLETAGEARDLVESASPSDLLGALELDVLEDGTEPGSLPEAIARGDRERVADLRRLLHLANLADRAEDDAFEGAVGDLRETIDRRDDGTEPSADGTESDATESGDATDSSDDPADRLRSSLRSSVESFGDEARELKERLEARSAGSADAGSTDDADEPTEEGTSTEDEGPLESGLGGDRDGRAASGGPSHHSTMAPPPSRRADMRGLVRHSTVPDRKG